MKKRTSSVMWGILLIVAAVFIVLSAFGLMHDVGVLSIIFTVLFAGIIISNIPSWNFWGIFLPLAGICIIYSDAWGIQRLTPWPVVAIAVLVSIGFTLIFKTGSRNRSYNGNAAGGNTRGAGYRTEYIDQGVNNIVNCSTKFASAVKHIRMSNFERANISLSFGNMDVYFDGCGIPSGHAVIDVDGRFGSLVLYIPAGWKVDVQAATMAGRVSERNRASVSADSPVVTLNGAMQFGSVEIQYI